jgi:D-alanyl-D-alanine carboxypeptidase
MESLRPYNIALRTLLIGAATATALITAGCAGGRTPPAGDSGAAPAVPLQALAIAQAAGSGEAGPASVVVQHEPAPPPLFPAPLPWAAAPRPRGASLPEPPSVNALAAVVVDEASGEVVFDKDAHLSLPPASLTKIATLILALESGRLEEWVEVDVDSRVMRGSTVMGLLPGDRFTLSDLLYGLMLPSGNDAALAIGRHLAGSDAAFAAAMNDLVRRLGLRESHFLNPHGLGGGEHVASAYDLAMLSRYGMSLPGFREIVTAPSWQAKGSRTLGLRNINSFLFSYPGADGLKTGYTRRAGQTLASSAVRNGHRLFAVVLNSTTRDEDARRLLNWAFSSLTWEPQ